MVVLHHLNNSRSQRILWLLEELGAEYRIKRYQRDATTMLAPPGLRRVHPLGKSPVITHQGNTVAESGAIVEYLVDHFDRRRRLRPKGGTPELLRWTYWLHYAEGSAMTPLLLTLVFRKVKERPLPFFVRPIAHRIADTVLDSYVNPQIDVHLDYMESELRRRPWFAGADFSAADIQMSFPIEAAASAGALQKRRPKLRGWLQRIREREAYQRALEKGGPYDLSG